MRIKPDHYKAHYNLGLTLADLGNLPAAAEQFSAALKINPQFVDAHYHYGLLLSRQGHYDEAEKHFQQDVLFEPRNAEGHYRLANVLLRKQRTNDALSEYALSVKLQPSLAEAHYQWGIVLLDQHNPVEAVPHLREAVHLNPDWVEAINNLAWILAATDILRLRDGPEALRLANHANELTQHGDISVLDTLAVANAENGDFSNAISVAQEAINLAEARGHLSLSKAIRSRLELYKSGIPFREAL